MRIGYEEMKDEFLRVLLSRGFDETDAEAAAAIFADNSLDGVYSHGVNRFPRIVGYLDRGSIVPGNVPTVELSFAAMERWNGNRGFGPLNAKKAMDRACDLSEKFGIGIVAMRETNHWLRGGAYGWQAADRGKIGICWSNTMPNMPAWGGMDRKIGNNPLVIAVPRTSGEHIVIDSALSQFSYGKLEEYRLNGKELPVPGGYDTEGKLSTDASEIEKTWRVLPMGFWKGSGLSVALDAAASVLADGNTVSKIGTFSDEVGLTQIFIAIDPTKMDTPEKSDSIVDSIVTDIHSSIPIREGGSVSYPGERTLQRRKDNLENGIPVVDSVWEEIRGF